MMTERRNSAAARIIARLKADPLIAEILPEDAKIVGAGHIGGGWSWVIEGERYHLGSEHSRREVADSVGMLLSMPAWGQIEIIPCPTIAGIEISYECAAEIRRDIAQRSLIFEDDGPPQTYTLYRLSSEGILTDVVADIVATFGAKGEAEAWKEVARLHGARATPSIIRSLKKRFRLIQKLPDVS